MGHTLLLEIGLEEMPANVIPSSIDQLKKKTEQFLQENRLSFGTVSTFSTPRRLTVQVENVAEKQEDKSESVKGPAKKIAVAEDGSWSKAAQGFVRGQGMTVEDIEFKEIKGVEYVFVEKFTEGLPALEVLKGLQNVVTSMNFPISMRWADHTFRYIRPIHWMAAMLDEEIIPFSVLDVQSGNQVRGHRFLGSVATIPTASEYEKTVADEYVIADRNKRKQMIAEQIQHLAADKGWSVVPDEELLNEVTDMVEYPTAYYGSFDEEFLQVPAEVLVTSMKDHQRYFSVQNEQGELLPYFIFVRNGNENHIENVAKGNEKVLTARLADAVFFFEEDKKYTIEDFLAKLNQVTFHVKLGSMAEKTKRIQLIASTLGKMVGLSDEELNLVERAAGIAKFDLVTSMVDEFPELQGVMGEKYALMQGEKPVVAQAIREHYMPTSSEGELPASNIGAVLSIADKLDSVMMFFAADVIPSGSNDPYALRRQAYGIVRIILDKQWPFSLKQLLGQLKESLPYPNEDVKNGFEERTADIRRFVKDRVRQVLQTKNIRHDVMEATLKSEQEDLCLLVETADVLEAHHEDEDFKPVIESLTRVLNLADKASEEWAGEKPFIRDNLFETVSERELAEALAKARQRQSESQNIGEAYETLAKLHPFIDSFFDENMVMAENQDIRKNRLAMLSSLAELILSFASVDHLVIK